MKNLLTLNIELSVENGGLTKLFAILQNRNHKIYSSNMVLNETSYNITLVLYNDDRVKTLVNYLEQSFFVENVSWK